MNMFESVSSEVSVISGTRSRQTITASLQRILEITAPHEELASVSTDITKYINSIDGDVRTMNRGQVVKRLKKRILPKIESLAAELDSRVPKNVIKTVERVVVTASISRGTTLVISSDMLFSASSKSSGEYLRTSEDIKLFRRIISAPYNHARLGLDILAAIADNITYNQRVALLPKLKSILFADEAVTAVYRIMSDHPELTYKEVVTQPTLRTDGYCDKFFPRSMGTRLSTGRYGDSTKFPDIGSIKRALSRLVGSRKHLRDLAELSPAIGKKHSVTFTDRSWLFLENMNDALRPVAQLARDKDITVSQKNLRTQLAEKYKTKIPTQFDASSAFTLSLLPVEAFVAGSNQFREIDTMEKYGVKLLKEQVGTKKNDASFFYLDQPVLFFHRELLIDHMLEELTETARASLDSYDVQVRTTRTSIKNSEKEIRELEQDRLEAQPKAARAIDKQIAELTATIEKLTVSQNTVKTNRAAAKKELDRRIKHYSKNRNEVLDTALRFVIETINERSTTDYTLVSSVYNPNPKSPVSSMAWLMPTRQYNALEGTLGNFSVTKWNLPWAVK